MKVDYISATDLDEEAVEIAEIVSVTISTISNTIIELEIAYSNPSAVS